MRRKKFTASDKQSFDAFLERLKKTDARVVKAGRRLLGGWVVIYRSR